MHEADIGKKREEERRREKKKQGKKSYYMLILEENEEDDRAFSSRPSSDNFRLPLTACRMSSSIRVSAPQTGDA